MKFLIYAPPYNPRSGGIRALYRLNEEIKKRGISSNTIIVWSGLAPDACLCDDDTWVIYPEIIHGNPLRAKKVVRWLLNTPGKLGGPVSFDESDVVVAYNDSDSTYSNGEILHVPVIEDFFVNNGEAKTCNCFYIGKWKGSLCDLTEGFTEITHDWPTTREDLAGLLKRTDRFYSYDDKSAINTEAMFCGCNGRIIRNGKLNEYITESVSDEVFQKQLDRFFELLGD